MNPKSASILDGLWVYCKICYKTFENLARLNIHINNAHQSGEYIYFDYLSYFTAMCSKVAVDYMVIRDPKAMAHSAKSINYRNNWFFHERLINEYFIDNIKDPPIFHPENVLKALWFICKLCDEFVCDLVALKKHFKKIHPGAPVEYKDCLDEDDVSDDHEFKQSLSKLSIANKKENSNVIKYVCQLCQKSYETASDLRQHAQKHFQFYCCVNCDLCFRNIKELKIHQGTDHVLSRNFIREDVIKANPANVTYDCSKCNKHFVDKQYYDAHNCQPSLKCNICQSQFKHYVNIALENDKKNVSKKRYVCRLCAIAHYLKHTATATRQTILTGVAFILNKIIRDFKRPNNKVFEHLNLSQFGIKFKVIEKDFENSDANTSKDGKQKLCNNCNETLMNPPLMKHEKKTSSSTIRTISALTNIENMCPNVKTVNTTRSDRTQDDIQADISFCDSCGAVAATFNKMKEHMIKEHGILEAPEIDQISYDVAESKRISNKFIKICCFCHECDNVTLRYARYCEEHKGCTITNLNPSAKTISVRQSKFRTFLSKMVLGVLKNINYFEFCIKCRILITEEHIDNCKEKSEEYIIKFGRDIVHKGIQVLLSQVIQDLRDYLERGFEDATSAPDNIVMGNEGKCNPIQQNVSDTSSSLRRSNPAKGKSLVSKRTPRKKGSSTPATRHTDVHAAE